MNTLDFDTELDFVRHQLEGLATMRSLCSLSAENELRYRDLCDMESTLLEVRRMGNWLVGAA